MGIMDKIKKNSSIKDSAILSKSKFFTNKDMITTSIPIINLALSGSLNGATNLDSRCGCNHRNILSRHSHFSWQNLIWTNTKMQHSYSTILEFGNAAIIFRFFWY
jgi:hypothetical protein